MLSNSSKALLIGINYSSIPANILFGCIDDVNNVKSMLVNTYKYAPSNITMITDDVNSICMPTYDNILNSLKRIVSASTTSNEIWIHYSGHGSQIQDLNTDETDKLDEVIVPIDYKTRGFITDDMIFDIIKNINCKAIIVFDSCNSESLCDLEWTFENDNGIITHKQNNNKTIPNPNIFMFSGCRDNQLSNEKYMVNTGDIEGVMTNALLTCLNTNNYTCSINKLYKDICIYCQINKNIQQPGFSSSYSSPLYNFINPYSTNVSIIKLKQTTQLNDLTKSKIHTIPISNSKKKIAIIPPTKNLQMNYNPTNMKMRLNLTK